MTAEYIISNGRRAAARREKVEFSISVFGSPLTVCVHVPPARMTLPQLVPMARWLSDRVARKAIVHAAQAGLKVPCRKGCCTCCHYLVPLAGVEALQMANEIKALPPQKQRWTLAQFMTAAKAIFQGSRPTKHDPESISRWYAELNTPCPFLVANECAIYENRPLACREHMVWCNPEAPGNCETDRVAELPLPVSILESLGLLAGELEQRAGESVILPLAIIWADQSLPAGKTYPADWLVRRFGEILCRRSGASRGTSPHATALRSTG